MDGSVFIPVCGHWYNAVQKPGIALLKAVMWLSLGALRSSSSDAESMLGPS